MNEYLKPGNLDHSALNFTELQKIDFLPQFKEVLKIARDEIKEFEKKELQSFDDYFVGLGKITEPVERMSGIFFSLYEVDLSDERAKISGEVSDLTTQFFGDLRLNEKLFQKLENLFLTKEELTLNEEQEKILITTYKSAIRNGAKLNQKDKERLKELDQKLAGLSLKFNENSLKALNQDYLHLEKESDLAGLPKDIIDKALLEAQKKNLSGWVFTLHAPSYFPFMTYAQNRSLRKDFYLKKGKVSLGGEFDNQEVIKETLKYRYERAQLLGYQSHADFVLEDRMAKKTEAVYQLLDELKTSAFPKAQEENKELTELLHLDYPNESLQVWDRLYYQEKLKKKKLNFDDEVLKPYFRLENVIEGVFSVASKMYDLRFTKRSDLPVYHDEVNVYEVFDSKKDLFLGLLYTDYFPRATKGAGAWCDQFQTQGFMFGEVRRPHVINVGNFNPSTKDKPSLLNFNEVLTLFHEFGHGLHTLLSNCHYRVLSGTNVKWDFVELPSQILENWCYQKECLKIFAKHYQTQELIPDELIEKLGEMNQFMQGHRILRQVGFANLDMAYHDRKPEEIDSIESFEHSLLKDYFFETPVANCAMSTSFGHLFGGGYSAGYYSYHWAEVLDADAFESFLEEGIFNKETAHRFRTEILERGATAEPEVLYRNFKGSDPSTKALLKRSGLM